MITITNTAALTTIATLQAPNMWLAPTPWEEDYAKNYSSWEDEDFDRALNEAWIYGSTENRLELERVCEILSAKA